MFLVSDINTNEVRVIKDCWVELRNGRQTEGQIVQEIKKKIQNFSTHFIDIIEDRKPDAPKGLRSLCDILVHRKFQPTEDFKPLVFIPVRSRSAYSQQAGTPNQNHLSEQPTPRSKLAPNFPPHPRFRYQVVYCEQGSSLYEAGSLENVFEYLAQTVEGAR